MDKTTALNLDRNLTGATIGYNVAVANNNFASTMKEKQKQKQKQKTNPSQFITRIASHPRNKAC